MRNRFRNTLKELRTQIHLDLANYDSTVLLAGSARSGTTWAQEIINTNNEYRVIFEPFHSKKIKLIKNWNNRQYLRPDNTELKYLTSAEKILQGKIRSGWTDKFNKKIIAKKRLIKDIRTNLLLKWMNNRFPQIKLVLLLRHPLAVTNSRMKLGWKDHLNDFVIQEDLVNDYLKPYLDIINNTNDLFERQIIMWCIENMIPLKQFNKGEILIIFYEDICIDPKKASEYIFNYLGSNYSKVLLNKFSKPSALSRTDSAINKGTNLVESWRGSVTKYQLEKSLDILKIFGMDRIYNENSIPLVSSNEVLDMF